MSWGNVLLSCFVFGVVIMGLFVLIIMVLICFFFGVKIFLVKYVIGYLLVNVGSFFMWEVNLFMLFLFDIGNMLVVGWVNIMLFCLLRFLVSILNSMIRYWVSVLNVCMLVFIFL